MSKFMLNEWIKANPELKLEGDKVIFCQACVKTIQCVKKYDVVQHLKTKVHLQNIKKYKSDQLKQQTVGTTLASTSGLHDQQQQFNSDLCRAMLKSNISLNKLKNNEFKSFLEKYCNRRIPDESTLRKNYVYSIYQETINDIKSKTGKNYVWFTVDETTDSCGRYVANLIIGVLCHDIVTKGYLFSSEELPKTNNITISKFFQEGLANFYLPYTVPNDKVLLMVSDGAAYMVKSSTNLKVFYNNLFHCTCLAHGINRVAESIRLQYPLVNNLISNGKKIFIKAPLGVQLFKKQLENTPLPPEPVLTRWGTWIDAAIYYANNFENFKNLILEFPEDTSKAVKECQAVLRNSELPNNLAFIKAYFSTISSTKNTINEAPGVIGTLVKN